MSRLKVEAIYFRFFYFVLLVCRKKRFALILEIHRDFELRSIRELKRLILVDPGFGAPNS